MLTYPDVGGVYVIHNLVNEHFYVGSTLNLRKRWNVHRTLLRKGTHHAPHLQNAWNKYGEKAFVFRVLQQIDSKDSRLLLEQHLIDSLSPTYNVSRLARSCEGTRRRPLTRARMREAANTPERIAHIRRLGSLPKSEEHRARIAESHKGLRPTEATRAKLRAASANRWARPEEREKLRIKALSRGQRANA